MKCNFDLIIIGTGIVGLSGAIYAGRMGLKTLVIGNEKGGTLAKTNVVENYPGFRKITGEHLTEKVLRHVKDYDVEIISKKVLKISKRKSGFKVGTKKKDYSTRTILFATGSKWRKLGVPGEDELKNKGVHYCALCDGPLYKNQDIIVVGGGDSAAKEALLLSKYAKKVYILARHKLSPEPINAKRVKANKKIEVVENIEVKEILGKKNVAGVKLTKKIIDSNKLNADAVFIDVGNVPRSTLAKKIDIKVNKIGEIIIDKNSATKTKGVYAAGDVADSKFKQAITGVGEAVKAVYGIYEYIKNEKIVCR